MASAASIGFFDWIDLSIVDVRYRAEAPAERAHTIQRFGCALMDLPREVSPRLVHR